MLEQATWNRPGGIGPTVVSWFAASAEVAAPMRSAAALRMKPVKVESMRNYKDGEAMADDSETIRRILRKSRTIAVVGLSAQWHRPSYFAAKYLQEHGYRVIPVNPNYDTVLGERCYPQVTDIPEPIDIVDCFRKHDAMVALAHEAVAKGAKCLWQQIGVV